MVWLNYFMGFDSYPNNISKSDDNHRTLWSSESYDTAKKAENDLFKTMKYIGLREVTEDDQKSGQVFKEPVFRVSNKKEDEEEATDCFVYDPRNGRWNRVDLTTATNPEIIRKKEIRHKKLESELGEEIKLLKIPGGVLDRASRHCERDINEVCNELFGGVFGVEISTEK